MKNSACGRGFSVTLPLPMVELIITAIGLVIVFSAAVAGVSAAPWLPTRKRERHQLSKNLALKDSDLVVDLGCGDGTILFEIARHHQNVTCIGYDISFLPLAIGLLRKLFGGKKYRNVKLRFGNLFKQNIGDATHVFLYLLAKSYPRLKEKFAAELKDEAMVIVEAWPMPDIEPAHVIREEGALPIYIYAGRDFRESPASR